MQATDEALRILMDRARGERSRGSGGFFFNRDAFTAGLRAVYDLGRDDERKDSK